MKPKQYEYRFWRELSTLRNNIRTRAHSWFGLDVIDELEQIVDPLIDNEQKTFDLGPLFLLFVAQIFDFGLKNSSY